MDRDPTIDAVRDQAVAAIKAEADRATSNVLPIIAEIRKSGATTFGAITDALNVHGPPTRAAGVGTR